MLTATVYDRCTATVLSDQSNRRACRITLRNLLQSVEPVSISAAYDTHGQRFSVLP